MFLAVLIVLALAAPGVARKIVPAAPAPNRALVSQDTMLLATFDFEGPGDTPDPQGWTTLDRSSEPPRFHVDDFAGLGGAYAPLEGSKSLWCGARPSPALCHYSTLPGYGNNWFQRFESTPFPVSGDLTLTFKVRWDTDAYYDFAWVEYLTRSGAWRVNNDMTGIGAQVQTVVFPEDSLAATTQLRILFSSNFAWSDQDGLWNTDGALEVDSLTVSNSLGVIDYQDFESEAVGALQTTDGDWTAYGVSPFGDFAGLVDGDGVYQEDAATFNHSHVWGFFVGSPDDMGCLGHPEQPVPPGARVTGDNTKPTAIFNVVLSPSIDLRNDISGKPVPWAAQNVVIDYDLYADHDPWHIQHVATAVFLLNGCWRFGGYYGLGGGTETGGSLSAKAWVHRTLTIAVPEGATHMRVQLGAIEFELSAGPHCHSTYPLFDNVEVRAVTEFVTGAGATPPRTHLEQNHPNPFNPATTIRYSLAANGHVSLRIYDVTGGLVRTLVDRAQNADQGPFRVEWDGHAEDGTAVASGVYFYRLEAAGIVETRRMVLLK